jgi:hexosaminidase
MPEDCGLAIADCRVQIHSIADLHSAFCNRRSAITLFAVGVIVSACGGPAPSPRDLPSIVPWPASIDQGTGYFAVTTATTLGTPYAELDPLAAYAAEALGVRVRTGMGAPQIELVLDGAASGNAEGYRLTVTPERIEVAAPEPAGVFYGLQSLRQLVPDNGALRTVPALTIRDAPRFEYRGLHLDVGRHMFPVEFIKRYIDLMALYKINTFHWHLTEDQGWRIEIEQYPRLTEVGGCRAETIVEQNFDPYIGDGTPYCGYYTQEQVREVVEHAARRFVLVIPEIEMPGHSLAALTAYPELACTEGPFEVGTRWGIFEDIYCPKEETFTFLENVLTEVMALFPGPYIHIGGDEAPKARWEESEVAQAVIEREGLADEHELQSWFVQRIERFLASHDRWLIGWDEILEGGLAPNATVMSWRGTEGGIAAARQGHDVIMTPTSHMYFDYYQGDSLTEPFAIGGFLPLEKVYAFEPVPDVLTPEEARHVLGAQANVWTEYMKTSDYVEYMVYPRLLALSEVVWSPKRSRNWESFVARLPRQLALLDRLGVNYRPLALTP